MSLSGVWFSKKKILIIKKILWITINFDAQNNTSLFTSDFIYIYIIKLKCIDEKKLLQGIYCRK